MPENDLHRRVLIMAPVGNDAAAMSELLNKWGIPAADCKSMSDLCAQITKGAGVLLLTEEALESPQVADLFNKLKPQPSWSEIPLIILTSGGESRLARLLNLTADAAGGVTLLERPLGAATLLRSVQVALRSRERQYQTRDLLATRAHLSAIVEFSDDAIISKDLNGIIMSWNGAAQRLFGYAEKEVIGKSITVLIPSDRLHEETTILERIRMGGSVEHYETVRLGKDGKPLDISLTISPLKDSEGRIIGASKTARDISLRKQADAALAEAREKLAHHAAQLEQAVAERTTDLRETNEQLESFVYSIAHDLRSPLRTITGYSQILRDDHAAQMDDTGRHLLKRIQMSSEFMDKLLFDLLAYGKTARARLELEPVDFRKAWETAVFQCIGQIEQTQAEVTAVEPFPVVMANEATLGQCLANLLSNALKFVASGVKPCVRCRAEDRGGDVRFWVEDNGIGVAPAQHERIFRVFERLHGSRYPGTGIGLSIVRKGVERMDGKVGLESEPDKGSRFWLELHKASA